MASWTKDIQRPEQVPTWSSNKWYCHNFQRTPGCQEEWTILQLVQKRQPHVHIVCHQPIHAEAPKASQSCVQTLPVWHANFCKSPPRKSGMVLSLTKWEMNPRRQIQHMIHHGEPLKLILQTSNIILGMRAPIQERNKTTYLAYMNIYIYIWLINGWLMIDA